MHDIPSGCLICESVKIKLIHYNSSSSTSFLPSSSSIRGRQSHNFIIVNWLRGRQVSYLGILNWVKLGKIYSISKEAVGSTANRPAWFWLGFNPNTDIRSEASTNTDLLSRPISDDRRDGGIGTAIGVVNVTWIVWLMESADDHIGLVMVTVTLASDLVVM